MNILWTKKVKTRKFHKCFGCREPIPVGVQAEATKISAEGEIYTNYLCQDCIDWMDKHKLEDYADSEGLYESGDIKTAKECCQCQECVKRRNEEQCKKDTVPKNTGS